MAVKFLQDTDWKQRERTKWSKDSWGCDNARVIYRGRADRREQFIDTLQRWQAMIGYPNMRLAHWGEADGTPSFPGVELNFVGFRDTSFPPVKSNDCLSLQSAQGSGTDTASGSQVSGTIQYKASRTTWTWYEKTRPNDIPRYNTVNFQVDPLSRIVSYSIVDEDTGKPMNSVPYSAFVAIFNSLIRRQVVTSFEREEIVPGFLWACRADVDYKVIN